MNQVKAFEYLKKKLPEYGLIVRCEIMQYRNEENNGERQLYFWACKPDDILGSIAVTPKTYKQGIKAIMEWANV